MIVISLVLLASGLALFRGLGDDAKSLEPVLAPCVIVIVNRW